MKQEPASASVGNKYQPIHGLVTAEPPSTAAGAAGISTRALWARLHSKLTLKQVSEKTGFSTAMISRAERGMGSELVPLKLEALAQLYGVRVCWLTYGEGSVKESTP